MWFTKYAPTVARIFLGLVFFVFGLNGFLNFLPMPPMEGAAAQFIGGLAGSGYFFPFLKGTEVLVGAFLLSGRFVPLTLTVLAPVNLNILAFNLFLTPAAAGLPVILAILQVFLMWHYRAAYKPLFQAGFQTDAAKKRVLSAA